MTLVPAHFDVVRQRHISVDVRNSTEPVKSPGNEGNLTDDVTRRNEGQNFNLDSEFVNIWASTLMESQNKL